MKGTNDNEFVWTANLVKYQPDTLLVDSQKSVSPGDVDIFVISSNVSNMSTQIQSLASSLNELRSLVEAAVNLKDDVNALCGQIQSMTTLQDNEMCQCQRTCCILISTVMAGCCFASKTKSPDFESRRAT